MDNVYAAPKSRLIDTDETPGGVMRRKKYVVTSKDVVWPNRCFKCNAATSNRKKLRLSYVNPWVYLSILINILVTIVLVLIFQKKFIIDLPLCDAHLRKRKRFLVMQWSVLAGTGTLAIAGAALDNPMLLTLSMIGFMVVVLTAIFSRIAYIAKRKNDTLWIKGAGAPFLASLKEYNPL